MEKSLFALEKPIHKNNEVGYANQHFKKDHNTIYIFVKYPKYNLLICV